MRVVLLAGLALAACVGGFVGAIYGALWFVFAALRLIAVSA